MEMRSSQISETNLLLRTLLSVTVNFLDAAYRTGADADATFQKVSCSIQAYKLDSIIGETNNKGNAMYTAKVTITGQAFFLAETNSTQADVAERTMAAFDEHGNGTSTNLFFQALALSPDPFLSNATYAAVTVNGTMVAEQGTGSAGDDGSDDSSNGPQLEVWMIALAGGGGAFLLVLCVVVACICCVKIDDDKNVSPVPSQVGNTLTVPTSTVNNEEEEEDREEDLESHKSLSPVKSIMSQDSSTFTYNPKSVMSFDSRTQNSFFSHNTGVEMDVAAWQSGAVVNQHQIPFGQDISAIEPSSQNNTKNDLSLIQEEDEETSACSPCITPATSEHSASRASSTGKYKTLLERSRSGGGAVAVQQYLTEAAMMDMEKQERSSTASRGSASSKSTNNNKQLQNMVVTNTGPVFLKYPADERDGDDDDSDSSSFYGPSYYDDATAPPPPRLNLSGSAAEVMNDLKDLSSEIDHFRSWQRSLSS